MNMSSVLHRKSHSDVAERPSRRASGHPPPSIDPPGPGGDAPGPWPPGARAAVAIMTVAFVLMSIVAAIAISTDGSSSSELDDRIATLTAERDAALADVAAADGELATVRQELADGVAARGDLEQRLAAAIAERDQAAADVEATSATIVDLERTVRGLEGEAESFTATIDELEGRAEMLDAALRTANGRLAAVTVERDALAGRFPIEIDATLDEGRLIGDHDVVLKQVFCAGAATCGTLPGVDELTISRTDAGNLRLAVPGIVEGGLFRADGALHLVADSSSVFPACAGAARQANVTITLFAAGYTIGSSGSVGMDGVNAIVTFEAPPVGDCPAALAFYTARLAPQR